MSIRSLLSIEKKRKKFFVLVGGVNCFGVIVRSSPNIMRCRLDWWEDLMENITEYFKVFLSLFHIACCLFYH